jgi:hypothetical protein
MMNEPAIIIRLDYTGRAYQPGDTLSGEYRLDAVAREELNGAEISVLWYTEGKGEEDLAVHEFWQRDAASGDWLDPRRPERFSTTLPPSPLSYEGQIVKIRWCVRIRAFLTNGKELVGQKVFRLGSVPPVKAKRACNGEARSGTSPDFAPRPHEDPGGELRPRPEMPPPSQPAPDPSSPRTAP